MTVYNVIVKNIEKMPTITRNSKAPYSLIKQPLSNNPFLSRYWTFNHG
jgi:hypothetical protein